MTLKRKDVAVIRRLATRNVDAFGNLTVAAEDAILSIWYMAKVMDQNWGPYRAKWARKRVSRYVRKGGVK